MQKFLLFKDGKPWKGFYMEVDLMNAYSQEFDRILDMVKTRQDGRGFEFAVYRFFKKIHPAKYVKKIKGYESVMREYVIGDRENDEAGIVCEIDYDDLNTKNRSDFIKYSARFEKRLASMNQSEDKESTFQPEIKMGTSGYAEFVGD